MNPKKRILTLLLIVLGSMSLSAQITLGTMKIGQGVSSPDDWRDYDNVDGGIYVDVNTSACSFTETPHYLVTLESIEGLRFHWAISGVPSVYNPSPNGFSIYLRWTDHPTEDPTIGSLNFPNPLDAATAKNRKWVIRWTAITTGDCAACDGVTNNNDDKEEDIETALETVQETSDYLEIFPNPSNGQITIDTDLTVRKCEIYDMQARLLKSSADKTIDISDLPNANYLVKVFIGRKIVTRQFIKAD